MILIGFFQSPTSPVTTKLVLGGSSALCLSSSSFMPHYVALRCTQPTSWLFRPVGGVCFFPISCRSLYHWPPCQSWTVVTLCLVHTRRGFLLQVRYGTVPCPPGQASKLEREEIIFGVRGQSCCGEGGLIPGSNRAIGTG